MLSWLLKRTSTFDPHDSNIMKIILVADIDQILILENISFRKKKCYYSYFDQYHKECEFPRNPKRIYTASQKIAKLCSSCRDCRL